MAMTNNAVLGTDEDGLPVVPGKSDSNPAKTGGTTNRQLAALMKISTTKYMVKKYV
jgi:hypothetical protein